MSFVTMALRPLHVRHGFPLERHRAKHADIEYCPVDVGFLARLPKRIRHECAASTAGFHAEMGRLWAWRSA
ncbi:hypothetical protein [Burkholderia cenocepacia]|uniref:hypothetical protein n=1 Tax=Burkholderia cenocepacia TaxID=95486 RepID=UPI0019D17FE5|nr:hypothetical protein [Burkholderia cenocepacia]